MKYYLQFEPETMKHPNDFLLLPLNVESQFDAERFLFEVATIIGAKYTYYDHMLGTTVYEKSDSDSNPEFTLCVVTR